MHVEYRILGPLDVTVDGRAVALGGRHRRALLALPLAHANEVAPLDRLIYGLWNEAPPETAANIVQGYVSQLRKLLGRETIVTRGRGYALIMGDSRRSREARWHAPEGAGERRAAAGLLREHRPAVGTCAGARSRYGSQAVGTEVAGYRIEHLLGRGGMSTVSGPAGRSLKMAPPL